MKWTRINTLLVFLLIAIFAFLLFNTFFPEDCKENKKCFDSKAKDCIGAKYLYENDGNIFIYKIIGSSINNSCKLEIKLDKVSVLSGSEIKNSFEGKSMQCTIPKSVLAVSPVLETSNLLGYCSGPLKEATLELMIQKLYGTVAQNLGSIINEVGKGNSGNNS